MTTGLKIASDLTLPLDLVVEATVIAGKRGKGKTFCAKRIVEEVHRNRVTFAVVDPTDVWFGLLSGADGTEKGGLDCVVLGGAHGDLPLQPGSGKMLARMVLDGVSVVLVTKGLTKADRRRVVGEFLTEIYDRATGTPILVVIDEADEYAPEGVKAFGNRRDDPLLLSSGAVDDVVRRGRAGGLGVILVTQRVAVLSKDVLTQADTLIALGVTGKTDIDAIAAWISRHAPDVETGKQITASLPGLPKGTAWVWSPELGILRRVEILPIRTYDSSRSPKVGEVVPAPRSRRTLDLLKLGEEMARFAEAAKADDPKELRKQIAELERNLTGARQRLGLAKDSLVATGYFAADQVGDDIAPRICELWAERARAVEPEVIRVSVVEEAQIDRLREAAVLIAPMLGDLIGRLDTLSKEPPDGDRRPDVPRTRPAGDGPRPVADRPPRRTPERTDPPTRRDVSRPAVPRPTPPADGQPDIGKGERQILIAVASYPAGVTREQLTVLTGYKRSSRDTYVQRLSAAGLAEKIDGRIVATDAGVAALGEDYEPLPTGSALRDYWLNRLGSGGEAVLLEALIDAYPGSLTGADFDEATPYKRSSRDTYLQRLRARELVTSNGGRHRAADTLFDLR